MLELLKNNNLMKNTEIIDDSLIKYSNNDGVNNVNNVNIDKLLNLLNKNRIDNYDDWIKVGMCLHNISKNNLEMWIEWSKLSKKFIKGECEKKWKGFSKKTDQTLSIGSLIYWVKEDNSNEYEIYKKENNIHNVIKENKDKFPLNKLDISNIIMNDDYMYVELNDLYCPIRQKEHSEKSLYLELTPYELVLKCHKRTCVGKKYPLSRIMLNQYCLKNVFNMNVNIVNNYNGINNDELEFDDTIIIFDNSKLNKLILKSLNGTSYKIAEVIYYLTKDKFNFGENNKWYEFKNHRWTKNSSIRNFISTKLISYYEKVLNHFEKNNFDDVKIKKVKKIIDDLETTYFKNNIVTECEEIFKIENNPNGDFVENLDNNIYLLGFENGIYDLENNVFRDGKPEDYVSLSVNYSYDNNENKMNELIEIINKILPNYNVREYVLKLLSVCLSGKVLQNVFFLNGVGSNGKSILINLMSNCLGQYFKKLSISMITQSRPLSESPTPQLLKTNKKRCIVFSEPNKDDKLNSGIIKELSGGEKITSRGLNQEPIDFVPLFKIFVLCNHLPQITEDEYSVWRRLRSIEFLSKFVDKPINKNEYLIDEELNEKLNNYNNAFVILLLKYWKKYQKEGLKDIEDILESTNKYKKENDFYQDYINEYIEENENGYIQWTSLSKHFSKWLKDNYKDKIVSTKDSKKSFINKLFKCDDRVIKIDDDVTIRGWKKYKLINII